jgi:catechol 2,3-dioxygenase-like lactoylglutathione lyase family enzyme
MHGRLHHVELWVESLEEARPSFDWLLTRLGYAPYQEWEGGRSWRLEGTYIVIEESPARLEGAHERRRPGLNHLAFHVAEVEEVTARAQENGWRLMFADRHPYAGGPGHFAAYLENEAGFEVELVAWRP